MSLTKTVTTSDRLKRRAWVIAFCLLPLAGCLAACGPDRRATVKADAATGYCPVCAMKVNATDESAAEIYYKDGTKLMFESPGDMLAFYTAPGNYKVPPAQQDRANITRVAFKDYQTRQAIDGRQAALVYGSRIVGPMGPDFFAFDRRNDAGAFIAANGGQLLGLDDVTPEMVQNLRRGH
jgi:copper chaperone NosL